MKDFVKFVREQGVVGLAVGLAIGTAAGETVKSIVTNIIDPLVGLITGGVDLSEIKLEMMGGDVVFGIGNVLNSIITLTAVAFVIYYIVKKSGLTELDAKKDE